VPTFKEDLQQAFQKAAAVTKSVIQKLLDWFQQRPQQTKTKAAVSAERITLHVTNNGDEAIRVLAGSNLDESQISSGSSAEVTAPGESPGSAAWVQLRQLGM